MCVCAQARLAAAEGQREGLVREFVKEQEASAAALRDEMALDFDLRRTVGCVVVCVIERVCVCGCDGICEHSSCVCPSPWCLLIRSGGVVPLGVSERFCWNVKSGIAIGVSLRRIEWI